MSVDLAESKVFRPEWWPGGADWIGPDPYTYL